MLNVFPGVEMSTGSWPKDRQFRLFMVNFAKEFKKDDFQDLKYALQIPARTSDNLETTLDLFEELQRRGIIGPGNLHQLRSLLEALGKLHLCFMIDKFDDSCSARYPALIAKPENFLEMDGYRLAVEGGRHFEMSEGGEFVEMRSGANYGLTITNLNCHRCDVAMKIDGYIFRNNFVLNPKQTWTIERPSREAKKFKFYAVADAPSGSGINKWETYQNGVVEVFFTPERADMKIVCVAQGTATQVLTCSDQTTDSEFYEMVLIAFGATNATIMINWWKPLSQRGVELTEYGITDGSRVTVNFGGRGGVNFIALPSIHTIAPKKDVKWPVKWRAGATTLNDESEQKFVCSGKGFPVDPGLAVSLNLRLVARDDERALPSTGECVPLAGRATLIPPPVPNYC